MVVAWEYTRACRREVMPIAQPYRSTNDRPVRSRNALTEVVDQDAAAVSCQRPAGGSAVVLSRHGAYTVEGGLPRHGRCGLDGSLEVVVDQNAICTLNAHAERHVGVAVQKGGIIHLMRTRLPCRAQGLSTADPEPPGLFPESHPWRPRTPLWTEKPPAIF